MSKGFGIMRQTGLRKVGTLLVLLAFLSFPALSLAGEPFGYLSPGELKGMIERNTPGLVIIDSRSSSQFEEAHIKEAVNIPLEVMEKDAALPKVLKDSRLVFYCSGNT